MQMYAHTVGVKSQAGELNQPPSSQNCRRLARSSSKRIVVCIPTSLNHQNKNEQSDKFSNLILTAPAIVGRVTTMAFHPTQQRSKHNLPGLASANCLIKT